MHGLLGPGRALLSDVFASVLLCCPAGVSRLFNTKRWMITYSTTGLYRHTMVVQPGYGVGCCMCLSRCQQVVVAILQDHHATRCAVCYGKGLSLILAGFNMHRGLLFCS
jgi:hypothetical protein